MTHTKLSFIHPAIVWLSLFVTGFIVSIYAPPFQYFNLTFGLISLSVLSAFVWSATRMKATSALLASLVIVSVKMFLSGVVFIYFFHRNEVEISSALLIGFITFLIYTTVEVYYGIQFSK